MYILRPGNCCERPLTECRSIQEHRKETYLFAELGKVGRKNGGADLQKIGNEGDASSLGGWPDCRGGATLLRPLSFCVMHIDNSYNNVILRELVHAAGGRNLHCSADTAGSGNTGSLEGIGGKSSPLHVDRSNRTKKWGQMQIK